MKQYLICLLVLFSILLSCKNNSRERLNDNVWIEKVNNNEYNFIFDEDTEDRTVFNKVDSVAYIPPFCFLIYGKTESDKNKKWYYVVGQRELRKSFGGWYDEEFKKYRLKEIDPESKLYAKVKSTALFVEDAKAFK